MSLDLFADKPRPNTEHLARIKAWVHDAWPQAATATVIVTELTCREPGCPPLETIIAVLDGSTQRKQTLHKAVADVTESDVRAAAATWR